MTKIFGFFLPEILEFSKRCLIINILNNNSVQTQILVVLHLIFNQRKRAEKMDGILNA